MLFRLQFVCTKNKATLEVAQGDREKALKMLEDPDALMANPLVVKIIAEGAKASDIEVLDGVAEAGESTVGEGTGSVRATNAGEHGDTRTGGRGGEGTLATLKSVWLMDAIDNCTRSNMRLCSYYRSKIVVNRLYFTQYIIDLQSDKTTVFMDRYLIQYTFDLRSHNTMAVVIVIYLIQYIFGLQSDNMMMIAVGLPLTQYILGLMYLSTIYTSSVPQVKSIMIARTLNRVPCRRRFFFLILHTLENICAIVAIDKKPTA